MLYAVIAGAILGPALIAVLIMSIRTSRRKRHERLMDENVAKVMSRPEKETLPLSEDAPKIAQDSPPRRRPDSLAG